MHSNLPTPPPSHSTSPAPSDRQKCVYECLPNLYHGSTESQLAKNVKIFNSQPDFAEEHPFFVADLSSVYKQHIRWKTELPRIEPFFAVKCNPDPYVIRLLAGLGLGFDCASQTEINTILSLPTNCPATENPSNNIIFANPCKAASMIKFARGNQVKMMTFDNTDELHKIARLYPDAQLIIRILTDDSKSVCRFGIKFGAPLDAVPHLLKTAKDLCLNVIGVSFHVGSGCYDPQSYVDAIERSKKTFEVGESLGFKFNLLDVGGGFGHDNFELLARSLGPAVDAHFPVETGVRVIAEPGRFYVHDAFTLATNIIAKRGSDDDINQDLDDQSPKVMFYQNDGVYARDAVDDWSSVKRPALKDDDKTEKDDWISIDTKRNIIKCAIAYTIATLFTFNPTLNSFISALEFKQKSQLWKVAVNTHTIASVTVWFNPARSRGSMLQAIAFAAVSLVFVTCVSSLVTLILTLIDFNPDDTNWKADLDGFIVAFIFIGVVSSIAAFSRLKMANQTFNSAATMSCIVFYSVVLRNGGIARLVQYLAMAIIGIIITSSVCLLIWPKSSTSALRKDLSSSLNSFDKDSFDRAVKDHDEAFVTLQAELPNALRERWLRDKRVNNSQIRQTYKHTVEAIERLAQHLTGLRSCLNMRDDMILKDDSFKKAFQMSVDIASKPMYELTETIVHVLRESSLVFERDSDPTLLTETRRSMLIASERLQRAIRKFDISSGIVLESSQPDARIDAKSFQEPSLITQFYLFNLRELASELYHLILLVDEISEHDLKHVFNSSSRNSNILDEDYQNNAEDDLFDESSSYFSSKPRRPPLLRRRMKKTLSKLIPIDPSEYKVNDQARRWRASKIIEEEHQFTVYERFSQILWEVLTFFERKDVKFAIRTGGALAILSMPSYISYLRPLALNLKLEWALISCFASLSPTVGQTNFMSIQRILGTIVGAAVAVVAFAGLGHSLFGAIGFPIFGFFFSLPCFYIVVGSTRYSSSGRFVLQSYNLVALYAFNLRDQDIHSFTIAVKRSTAVTCGITFSMIVSRLWWPQEARKELRRGLGDLILDLGYLYNRHTLAQSVSPIPTTLSPVSVDSFDAASDVERASETTHLLSPQRTLMGEQREEQLSKEFMSM
ncbi:hypothetical protein E3Q18_01425 [Wallemia mellicola]|nr:hypothetical protein E3Q18_01425 [Wallemia mellicola]